MLLEDDLEIENVLNEQGEKQHWWEGGMVSTKKKKKVRAQNREEEREEGGISLLRKGNIGFLLW